MRRSLFVIRFLAAFWAWSWLLFAVAPVVWADNCDDPNSTDYDRNQCEEAEDPSSIQERKLRASPEYELGLAYAKKYDIPLFTIENTALPMYWDCRNYLERMSTGERTSFAYFRDEPRQGVCGISSGVFPSNVRSSLQVCNRSAKANFGAWAECKIYAIYSRAENRVFKGKLEILLHFGRKVIVEAKNAEDRKRRAEEAKIAAAAEEKRRGEDARLAAEEEKRIKAKLVLKRIREDDQKRITAAKARNLAEQKERNHKAAAAAQQLAEAKAAAEKKRLAARHSKRMSAAFAANKDAVAVIIGNRDYKSAIPAVAYAHNDADAMKRFITEMLGYREGNIIDLRDATQAQMEQALGNERSHRGRLWRYVRELDSDVLVFYSGHGVPGLQDRRGYLLPINADPDVPEISGYPIDVLYTNLQRLNARRVMVFLDTCFSGESAGGMLVRAASGIAIQPKISDTGRQFIVITAAQGDQVASWDSKKKQGLFTRYLLEALYGAADGRRFGNGDGTVSLNEVRAYLDGEMTYAARRQYGRIQNAWIKGDDDVVLIATLPE